eukprot:6182378-Pleurochrysis_carterae.AAC.4
MKRAAALRSTESARPPACCALCAEATGAQRAGARARDAPQAHLPQAAVLVRPLLEHARQRPLPRRAAREPPASLPLPLRPPLRPRQVVCAAADAHQATMPRCQVFFHIWHASRFSGFDRLRCWGCALRARRKRRRGWLIAPYHSACIVGLLGMESRTIGHG